MGKIIDVRDDILKALEEARNAKTIGKSLEAKVTVYAKEDVVALLNDANIDFAQLSIVSAFEVVAIEEAPAEALTLEHVSIVVERLQVRNVSVAGQFLKQLVQMKHNLQYVLAVQKL